MVTYPKKEVKYPKKSNVVEKKPPTTSKKTTYTEAEIEGQRKILNSLRNNGRAKPKQLAKAADKLKEMEENKAIPSGGSTN